MTQNISYALVKVESNGYNNTIEQYGYLLGFQALTTEDLDVVKAEDEFIWIFKHNSVSMFSPQFYSIREVTIGFPKGSSSTVTYRTDENSQKEAIKNIKDITESLKKQGIVMDNGIIDHLKYTDIPESIKALVETTFKTRSETYSSTKNNTHNTGNNSMYGHHSSYYSASQRAVYKTKEISTINFNRTTKYDVSEALAAMTAKINEIKENTYKPPTLKHIPADDVVEEEKTTTNPINYEYDRFMGIGY